ncbi:MAG: hypothetical protein ACP5C3_08335 [Methanomicrobiales archaeon]
MDREICGFVQLTSMIRDKEIRIENFTYLEDEKNPDRCYVEVNLIDIDTGSVEAKIELYGQNKDDLISQVEYLKQQWLSDEEIVEDWL